MLRFSKLLGLLALGAAVAADINSGSSVDGTLRSPQRDLKNNNNCAIDETNPMALVTPGFCQTFFRGKTWCPKCATSFNSLKRFQQNNCNAARDKAVKYLNAWNLDSFVECDACPTCPSPGPCPPPPPPPRNCDVCDDLGAGADPDWYGPLMKRCSLGPWTTLKQEDFTRGTFRILKSGCYKLAEDIIFAPNPNNDYWPFFHTSTSEQYPMGQFALGFFAAITIEANGVVLDLNGKTLKMSKEFSLKQRFHNLIQVSSRVFEVHDGMNSLNIQDFTRLATWGLPPQDFTQAPHLDNTPGFLCRAPIPPNLRMQPNAAPEQVIIRNGVLGLSSHNGIHGNGSPKKIMVEDLKVTNFEIAGIQFNGAKELYIRNVEVGAHAPVFALATLASARFQSFWFAFFWQLLWTDAERRLTFSDDNTITFADRPGTPIPLWTVFSKMFLIEQVYVAAVVHDLMGGEDEPDVDNALPGPPFPNTPDDRIIALFQKASDLKDQIKSGQPRSPELLQLLAEGEVVFNNVARATDGGSHYGITIRRRRQGVHRAGSENWNFYNSPADADSTQLVRVFNVTIHGLAANSLQVPTLVSSKGGLSGPTGENIRIADITHYQGQFSLREPATYKGNFLSDSLFAFYKIDHDFWQFGLFGVVPPQLYDDENVYCGNDPFAYTNPRFDQFFAFSVLPDIPQNCKDALGVPNFPELAARFGTRICQDPGELHRQFFGAITITEELYAWVTGDKTIDGRHIQSLQDMLNIPFEQENRKQRDHRILCGGDTQFHASKGVIPFKIEFASDIRLQKVQIMDIVNTGDKTSFFCEHAWEALNEGIIGPTRAEYHGADIVGLMVTKSNNVFLSDITIDNLNSAAGHVTGVDLLGDLDGSAMVHLPTQFDAINMCNVHVGTIRGGQPFDAIPLVTDTQIVTSKGFTSGPSPNLQNKWNPPLASITIQMDEDSPLPFNQLFGGSIITDAEATNLLDLAVAHANSYYGVGTASNAWTLNAYQAGYVRSFCSSQPLGAKAACIRPSDADVFNVYYSIPGSALVNNQVSGPFVNHGFPMDLKDNEEIRVGILVIKGLAEENIKVRYNSLIPEVPVTASHLSAAQRYEIFSDTLGFGMATGITVATRKDATLFKVSSSLQLIMHDQFKNFQIKPQTPTIFQQQSLSFPPTVNFDVRADGRITKFQPITPEVTPLTDAWWYESEGGIKDIKRWLLESESQIRQRRFDFSTYVSTTFPGAQPPSITALNTSGTDAFPLENNVGGLVAYTATLNTDYRAITGVDNALTEQYFGTRVIEVGFKFTPLFGGAPNGVVKQGVYILENCVTPQSLPAGTCHGLKTMPGTNNVRIAFQSIDPMAVNDMNEVIIHEALTLPDNPGHTGSFIGVFIQYPPLDQNVDATFYDVVGSMKFWKK